MPWSVVKRTRLGRIEFMARARISSLSASLSVPTAIAPVAMPLLHTMFQLALELFVRSAQKLDL